MATRIFFVAILAALAQTSFGLQASSALTRAAKPLKALPALPASLAFTAALTPQNLALAILAPSSLGFVKREYGVSYGYGGAIASAAYLVYKNAPNNINKLHASLHLIYGIRLCVFLLFRETTIPRFREMRERIEKNSPSSRWKRAPFILQCATLYFLMSLPLVITHIVPAGGTLLQLQLTKAALGVAATGLAINIVGDLHKTIAKARGRSLVTGGLFSLLRHPNYTGELILWTGSTLAALLTAYTAPPSLALLCLCAGSVMGLGGIAFILAMAATGLERRQREQYGGAESSESNTYSAWVSRTWGGLTLPPKKT